jgi:uncharacterized protein (TIGR00255 family)
MTGFGQASGGDDRHRVTVGLRSVNGKFLDLSCRLREEHRGLEPALRATLESELHRGRIDATVEIRSRIPRPADVEVQMEVVRALHAASHELAEKGFIATELRLADLLGLPEVVEVRVAPDRLEHDDEALVLDVCRRALDQLVEARETEGTRIATMLEERLDELERLAASLAGRLAGVRDRLREGLERRLADLLGDRELDQGRLAQEVALLVDRTDVTEETDRLGAHLAHFREVMAGPGPMGKRLDFLSQELLRELNTIGAKARDAELTRHVVDAKVVCEQLREQVQNVE